MNKLLTVGLVLAVLLTAAVGVSYPKADVANRGDQGVQGVAGPQGPVGPQGSQGLQGLRGLTGQVPDLSGVLSSLQSLVSGLQNQSKPNANLGGFSGPVLNTPFLTVNRLTTWYQASNFGTSTIARVASSTLCMLSAPRATSSMNLRINISKSTTTPLYLLVEKRSEPFAPQNNVATSSSGVLATFLVPANTAGEVTLVASSSTAFGDGKGNIIEAALPNATSSVSILVHLKNAGGGGLTSDGTGNIVGGSCSADFKEFRAD